MSSGRAAAVPGAPPIGTRHIPVLPPAAVLPSVRESVDVLLWFTTDGCVPCQDLAPALDEFARLHGGRVLVRAVDGRAAGALTELFQVAGFPTLALLHRGARVWQRCGEPAASVEEVEAVLLPLVQRLELRRHAETDVSPRSPLPRAGRVVTVPSAPRTSMEVGVVLPGGSAVQRLAPGVHRLARGTRLTVTLRADHRVQPPLDLDLLDRLEPGSVDELEVVGHPVAVPELAVHPAVREITALMLPTGPVEVVPSDLEAFGRLTVLETDPAWPAPVLSGVVVNGDWVLPELRPLLPSDRTRSGSGTGGLPEVGDADAERSREGTVLLGFTDRSSRLAQDVLAVVAQRRPDVGAPTVLAVDATRSPVLAAEHEVTVVPTLLLLRDGLPLWRTSGVVDDASVERCLAPLLDPGAVLDGRTLRRAATRPRRRLRLPSGPLPYLLHLQPPGLPTSASTTVLEGGKVEVPQGWTTHATVDPGDERFEWSALEVFGARDLDALHYLDADGDPARLRAGLPTLASMVGLRTLEVVSDGGTALLDDLLPVLSAMTELRVLSIEPATAEDDGPGAEQLRRLRVVLPDTVVNGEWSGLTLRPVPRQRPAEASPGVSAARHDEGHTT